MSKLEPRKAYSTRRRNAKPGARAPYNWEKFMQEIKSLLPGIFYSDYYVMWLTELELSFLLIKYGHELSFFEIDDICRSRGLDDGDPNGKKYWRGLGA